MLAGIALYRWNMMPEHSVQGDEEAPPGKYSDEGEYRNITPMKHDIFKSLTVDIVLILFVFVLVEVLGGVETFFDWSDFLSFQNFRKFRLSIVGGSITSIIGLIIFYQFVEPYIVNRIPPLSQIVRRTVPAPPDPVI